MMLKAKALCYRLVKSRKATSCALPSEPSPSPSVAAVSAAYGDHRSRCLSLIVKLGRRGLVDSAREVIRRVIDGSSSISEAALVVDFAGNNGIELDSCCCGALIRKLTEMGQPGLAETFYNDRVIGNGMVPDSSVLDSMVFCLVKLRRFDEARAHLDSCIASGYVPSRDASSLVIDELCNQDRFLEGFHCFEQVKKGGSGLWLWCCKRLFKGLCDQGHLDEAVGMLDTLCEMTRMPLPMNLYKSLFYGFCKRGCAAEAEALFDHMEADGYVVDKVMYTWLMKEYCKDNNMTMAMQLYLRMVEKSCEVDPCIFNTLIHGFMKLGMLDKGRLLFSQMIKKGVQLNVFTYHIMIGSYCKEGNVDYALKLFENNQGVEDISRNVHCYTNLIYGFYKKGGLDKAVDLLMRMLENGIVPDHITYFVLLKMLPKCHELKYAMVILQAIFDNGCGIDPPVIDGPGNTEGKIESLLEKIARKDVNLAAVGLAVVTTALCSQRKYTAALSRIEKMVNLGCTPLPFSYNSVIKCLFQEGVIEDFGSLVNLIQKLDFVPDLDTYLIVVNELCKNNDRDAAFAVIDVMEAVGLRPTVAIYSSIIGSLGRQGRVVEAEETFAKMLESGIQPDEIAYMIMINAYARNARINEANELVEEVVKHFVRPSSFTYTVLISGFVKMGMMEKGCQYLDKMLEDGLSPNAVLYTSLIGHFLKKGDFKSSFTLFGLMGENEIKHDHVAYITLLSGLWRAMARKKKRQVSVEPGKEKLLRRLLHTKSLVSVSSSLCNYGSKSFAMEVIGKVKKSIVPNLYLHNVIMTGYCAAGRLDEAYNHLESMQKGGIVPNQVTYTILMKYHIEAGEMESAIDLYEVSDCEPDQVMYSTLLKGLCESKRPLDALALMLEMQKQGINPNEHSFDKLLQCLCYYRLTMEAVKVVKDMAALDFWPRPISHTWLIYILCEEKKLREARALFAIMVQSGRSLLNCTKPGLLRMLNQNQQL
ncbi:PREDICTED: pentatricopeptide repeat-containing protein At5g62370-like [Camelina sativa]|uniref:Pentatricopeptide repeat-containing protein At5g62370-like n=1 Tax=Camelina sativa TaxID=90675 RepID=A0ABM0XFL5_CAMSA|nr:PREDICTED: pentatricopeptide repeat-containing protein At5g62370-like [Camelina sativa]